MEALYCRNISPGGFAIQIFRLINSIIETHIKQKKILIIGDFNSGLMTVPIDSVLNLKQLNLYLEKEYGLTVISSRKSKLKFSAIEYGLDNNKLDITDFVLTKYLTNILYIPKTLNLNAILGDPIYGSKKNLYIKYQIDQYQFEDIYPEYNNNIEKDIIYDEQESNFEIDPNSQWVTSYDKEKFDKILSMIEFSENYNKLVIDFRNKNLKGKKINILHLRLEDDAIQYWASKNKMNYGEYKNIIETKYIQLIKKFVNKNDATIVVSASTNNNVLNMLKSANYKYYFVNKTTKYGKEEHAIFDYLISKYCNNIFIGNIDLNNQIQNGSGFSYIISRNLTNKVKQILIKLEKINAPYYIHQNKD